MKIIENLAGNVHLGKYTFTHQNDISAFIITLKFADADNVSWPPTSLDALLDGITLTTSHTDINSNNTSQCVKTDLSAVAAFSTFNEGVVRVVPNGTSDKVNSITLRVPVGVEAALDLSGSAKLHFTIEGLKTTATSSLSISAENHIATDYRIVKYENLACPQDQTEQNIELMGLTHLILPDTSAFSHLRITGSNDRTVEVYRDELQNQNDVMNDIVVAGTDGFTICGYSSWLVVPVALAKSAIIVTDKSGYPFYGIRQVVVADKSQSVKLANGLGDTTLKEESIQAKAFAQRS